MSTLIILEAKPECEIVTKRLLNFTREAVYTVWTDPKHLKKWWGPKGFSNTFNRYDFVEGGKWSFVMHGPTQGNYNNECVFVRIKPRELVVWNHESPPVFQGEVIFEEISPSQTKVTYKMKFHTIEECKKLRGIVPGKNEENLDRLEAELTMINLSYNASPNTFG
ncbi:ATPase [Echinicola soli]|uniref:ATPase n=1 Tax=Echinicola soli TaxID=2591634 RepID=A0A514CIY4_9BACT|nr:SRPBCC domain-containing protein [Echinicola soli]QDH79787.1 ATPase [Echinicola soli]